MNSTEVTPEIHDLMMPTAPTPWVAISLAVAAAVLALGVLLVVFLHYRKVDRGARAAPRPPGEVALAQLRRIEEEASSLTPNAFALQVSDTLKDYLHARFGDRYRYETSEEFLRRAGSESNALPLSVRQSLSVFIALCDELKFGRPGDAIERCSPLLREARQIIQARPEEVTAHAV